MSSPNIPRRVVGTNEALASHGLWGTVITEPPEDDNENLIGVVWLDHVADGEDEIHEDNVKTVSEEAFQAEVVERWIDRDADSSRVSDFADTHDLLECDSGPEASFTGPSDLKGLQERDQASRPQPAVAEAPPQIEVSDSVIPDAVSVLYRHRKPFAVGTVVTGICAKWTKTGKVQIDPGGYCRIVVQLVDAETEVHWWHPHIVAECKVSDENAAVAVELAEAAPSMAQTFEAQIRMLTVPRNGLLVIRVPSNVPQETVRQSLMAARSVLTRKLGFEPPIMILPDHFDIEVMTFSEMDEITGLEVLETAEGEVRVVIVGREKGATIDPLTPVSDGTVLSAPDCAHEQCPIPADCAGVARCQQPANGGTETTIDETPLTSVGSDNHDYDPGETTRPMSGDPECAVCGASRRGHPGE